MLTDELINYLFDERPHLLTEELSDWLKSRRFMAFVDNFRDKIRKKIRTIQEEQNILDLRLELETAYRLVQEKALSLVYEPQMAEKIRRPDFEVSYTTSSTFMVEVTRLRTQQKNAVADAICDKLSQFVAGYSNVLIIGTENLQLTENDLRVTLLNIQQRAESNDLLFLNRYQFRDRAHFFNCYQRLSEILIRKTSLQTSKDLLAWVNHQAKHPLPSKVRTTLYRSQSI